jgi:hypothetical protein
MFHEIRDSNLGRIPSYKSPARTLATPALRLVYWINERERIRAHRVKYEDRPWTTDPILDQFKFCNVRREDDRVTIWIKDHWREPNKDDPNMWFAMGVARMINWPPTLKAIGYPHEWRPEYLRRKMSLMKEKKEQVFTGAYMITNAGQRMSKIDTVIFMLDNLHKQPRHPYTGDSLAHAHEALMSGNHNGMGPFMAGQVIADCKHTHLLSDAPDWWDWCAPGPGSQRGLSRMLGMGDKFAHFRQDTFIEKLKQLRKEIQHEIKIKLCLQDLQSCLCEFDKFERTLWGEGRPRSRYKPPKIIEGVST